MTHAEFVDWLNDEVSNGRMTEAEMNDLLGQKALFDSRRTTIESEYNRRFVGYVAGNLLVDDDIHRLIGTANAKFPDKLIYFEPVGITLI